MLEILQAPDQLAAFRLTGKVTGVDYDQMIAEIEERLRRHARIAVFVDLTSFGGLTRNALSKDIDYLKSKWSDVHRFIRLAIVSDKRWPGMLAHLAGAWLPFEIMSFRGGERDRALSWAGDARAEQPAVQLIRTTRPDTYGWVWNGKITRADLDNVLGTLQVEMESHISVRVLGRIEHMGGFEPAVLLQSSVMRVKLLGVRKIERYALVGGPRWLPQSVRLAHRITGMDIRHFPLERENDAWDWLEARPRYESDAYERTFPASHPHTN
jgi:hypothetical protein